MIIDVKPEIRKANYIEKVRMELYGYDALYVLATSDGKEVSTEFDEKQLEEFCRGKTVSQVMAQMQSGTLLTLTEYRTALATNIHPYWTATRIEEGTGKRLENQPLEMTKAQRKFIEFEVERLKKIAGEMFFVKIIL